MKVIRLFAYFIIILSLAAIGLGVYIYPNYMNDEVDYEDTDDFVTTDDDEVEDTNTLSESAALKVGGDLWEYALSTYWHEEPAWPKQTTEVENTEEDECATTLEKIRKKYTDDFIFVYTDETDNFAEDKIDAFMPTDCNKNTREKLITYKETNLKIRELNENEITFHAESKYDSANITQDFVIVRKENTWFIKRFFLPN